ncbi:hypothetical protein BT96DRAFT_808098 [Gymnopus androsaceus JB14]|uniref:Uncharacterized protein n=1 Tax=Gymnopus androsaceus JB14 TaxID=1447944 RepID=A0A6A4ID31_9AGAR|nr:hypothetical protein BT96DRAFT_808098 [Gymnopus androsaceus JB14]
MFFSNTLVALFAAATFAAANPSGLMKRDSNSTTCSFVVTPTPDASLDVLDVDINYAVGHTVGEEYEDHILTDVNTLVANGDGTYDLTSVIAVDGETPAAVGAFVDTWADTTIAGLNAQWFVNSVDCVE